MHPIRKDSGERLFVTVKQTGGSGTGNVLQEQHGVAFEQQGKATVLALKRRAHLHGVTFVTENTWSLAVGMSTTSGVEPIFSVKFILVPIEMQLQEQRISLH